MDIGTEVSDVDEDNVRMRYWWVGAGPRRIVRRTCRQNVMHRSFLLVDVINLQAILAMFFVTQ